MNRIVTLVIIAAVALTAFFLYREVTKPVGPIPQPERTSTPAAMIAQCKDQPDIIYCKSVCKTKPYLPWCPLRGTR